MKANKMNNAKAAAPPAQTQAEETVSVAPGVTLSEPEMTELRVLEGAQTRSRVELANIVVAQQQAMNRVFHADQAYQERVAQFARAHGIDLSGASGRWNFDPSTGVFSQ